MAFETDKSNGFKLDLSDLLRTGVYPDVFDRSIPMWAEVNNVQYNEFGLKRKAGRAEKADFTSDTDKPIRGLTSTIESVVERSDADSFSGTAFDDKVAYIGALDKIFSFQLKKQQTNTVGTDYSLVESVSATTWTVGGSDSDSGNTEFWDSGSTTWDEGVNVPETWVFETFGSFVVGASGGHKAVVKKNNINFNTFFGTDSATPTGAISGVFITNGGSGYSINDTITNMTASGSASSTVDLKVTGVSAGAVTSVEVTSFGDADNFLNTTTLTDPSPPGGGSPLVCSVTVPSIPYTKVKIFKRQGPHLLAFNYSTSAGDNKTSFSWCSADDIDIWHSSASNTAGNLQIREANGEIICVTQLGNSLAVYTENQMFLVSYVGLPNIFGYRKALDSGVGAVSPHSVVSVGRKNYGLCKDGFFVTDGSAVNMIGRPNGINDFFVKNVSENGISTTVAFNNAKENEVVWAIPLNTINPDKEIYYNYKTNQWGMRDSTITQFHPRGIFDEPLSASGRKLFEEGSTPNLENSNTFAITKAHDLNNADRVKEITQLRVGKVGSGNPVVSLATTDTINADPSFTEEFTVNETFENFPVRKAGRYIHLKIASNGESDDWEISDLVVQGRFEGER